MERRTFLSAAGVGIVGSLAGCTGSSEPGTMENKADQNTSSTATTATKNTSSESESTTETASPSSSISIKSAELKTEANDYGGQDVYALVEVINNGSSETGQLHLVTNFYNGDESLVGNGDAFLTNLAPNEMWQAEVQYLGTDGETIVSQETHGEVSSPNSGSSEGLTVMSSSVEQTEYETIATGEIKNERSELLEYVQADVKFYKSDNVVIASEWTNVQNLGVGKTWKFEVYFSGLHPEDIDHVTVRPSDSAF